MTGYRGGHAYARHTDTYILIGYDYLASNMGVNKTISLDAQTALIAERLPNFSQFVRESLIRHARMDEIYAGLDHIAPETARVWGELKTQCNPNHKKGLCLICWGGE